MVRPKPSTAAGRAGLNAILAGPKQALIAVDYDGTLAPIVPDPTQAVPAAGAVEALIAVAERVGTLAIVTGRPVRDVLGFLHLDRVDGLAAVVVAGQYGLERFVRGQLEMPTPAAAVDAARQRLSALLADAPGARLEDKGHALAVHTRGAGDPAGLLATLTPPLRALGDELGLTAEPGRFVLELRPPGMDKGGALRRLVAEYGARAVLFAGDDLGDLAAFAAVESLRADGIAGVTVCSRSAEVTVLADRADLVVDGPLGVVDLLRVVSAA
jgi:trehalose 6-phosphate phosphatase